MKKTIIVCGILSIFVLVYTIAMYKKPTEDPLHASISLMVATGIFIVICFSVKFMGEIPKAEDILQTGTEYEILGIFPEGDEYILVVAETLDIDDYSDVRIHLSVRIEKDDHKPEIGKFFHVDNSYHLIIDGTRAEIKSSREMSSGSTRTS